MKKDLSYLPEEIIMTEILTRLPAQTILRWKRVCKSWKRFFETHDFAKSHFSNISKLAPGFAHAIEANDKVIIQLANVLEEVDTYKLHLTDYVSAYIRGSVDGLLLLRMVKSKGCESDIYLCNPISREYIDLLHPHTQYLAPQEAGITMHALGVTKITSQYKVVSIFFTQTSSECKVYTVGTGSWRSIAPHAHVHYIIHHAGAFLNGNLHWLARNATHHQCISCLDLETELFTTLALPLANSDEDLRFEGIVAVEGGLRVCDYAYRNHHEVTITIWLMKEYGDDKSWTKEFVIRNIICDFVHPIKVFKDGVVLEAPYRDSLYYYSTNAKTIQRICQLTHNYNSCVPHIQTFLSLKSFALENVVSF